MYKAVGERGPERDVHVWEAEYTVEMLGGIGPRSEVDRIWRATWIDPAENREQRRPVERVEDVLRRAVAATCDHDAVGEPCGIRMIAPEDMNKLVRNDTETFGALSARRIDPYPPARDLEVEGPVRIAGGVEFEARQGEANVLALWRPDLRPASPPVRRTR